MTVAVTPFSSQALMVLQALLTLVFLAMILRKLDGIQGTLPWIIVFSPLYVSNFMRVGK